MIASDDPNAGAVFTFKGKSYTLTRTMVQNFSWTLTEGSEKVQSWNDGIGLPDAVARAVADLAS
jgi:hypothetical protein